MTDFRHEYLRIHEDAIVRLADISRIHIGGERQDEIVVVFRDHVGGRELVLTYADREAARAAFVKMSLAFCGAPATSGLYCRPAPFAHSPEHPPLAPQSGPVDDE